MISIQEIGSREIGVEEGVEEEELGRDTSGEKKLSNWRSSRAASRECIHSVDDSMPK